MAKKTTIKKSTKKSAPKKSSAKARPQVQAHAVMSSKEVVQPATSKLKSLKLRKSYVILVIVMLALGALLYYSRGLFVAAVVNGQPISRVAIVSEAEKQSGKAALDNIIRNTLIEQEARKQKVTVTEKEINDEVKRAEETVAKKGLKLDQALAAQGIMSLKDFRELIKLDKLVGKIIDRDSIKVTDKEVDEWIEQNKNFLPQDQSEEQKRKTATEEIRQTKVNQKVQSWLESLKNKAKILYFVQY